MSEPLIIIPARMASTRLSGKPLADIHGKPMIVHVQDRAKEAGFSRVWVACAEDEIKEAVEASDGRAVMTDPGLPSGTDRVWAAAQTVDPGGEHEIIINVQGDMPTLNPDLIKQLYDYACGTPAADIVTAVVETTDPREIADPNVVKAVIAANGKALYFSRAAIPHGEGPVMHHVGIYAYRRAALKTFCELPPSRLEKRERLEQLRALENGMIIHAIISASAPHGVDTPDDLARARSILSAKNR